MTGAEQVTALAVEVVRRELGETPTASRHVGTGRSNDVVRVEVESGRAFAVRVSKLGRDRFEMESAVMRVASEAGVPVPAVRFVGAFAGGEDGEAAMIADWVHAPTLASTHQPDVTGRREVADDLARVLASIHSCPVGGVGNLDADLRGAEQDFVRWFAEGAVGRIERSIEVIAAHAPGGEPLAARAAELLAAGAHVFGDAGGCLAHGDVGPSNLLVDGTSIAAVIDWESAKGGPPALDLGWLAFIDPRSVIDRAQLTRTYAAITDHDPDELARATRLVELRILATMPEWQARAGLGAEIAGTMERLADALKDFTAPSN